MQRLSYKDANGRWAVDDWERGITQRGLAIDRLAAFENICFAPDGTERISVDHIRELAEADKDGRCMVLPCKSGEFRDMMINLLDAKTALEAQEGE